MLLFILPAILLAVIIFPLFAIYKGKVDRHGAKRRVIINLCSFAAVCCAALLLPVVAAAAPSETAAAATSSGLGYIAAALATSCSSIGAGIAVAAAAPAAIGAVSEDSKAFGKAIIFVALGEGVAIYGLLTSILILNKI